MPPSGDAPDTFGGALAWAIAALAQSSDTVRLDAEILLTHLIGRDRGFLRARPEQLMTPGESAAYRRLITQRREGWPIAYLTGEREFWSRVFKVVPGVLIPRPETELLIDVALDLFPLDTGAAILDLGTGTGIIAITLALERPNANLTATDASHEALRLAAANAGRLGARHLRFAKGHWFEPLSTDAHYDLIVSNPPYIAAGDPHLMRNGLQYEPLAALASGPDGLAALRAIISGARAHLSPGGGLLLEHGYDQAVAVAALLTANGYREIRHHRDLQGHRRATMARYAPDFHIAKSSPP
jgi:release factor glutamine methyltransferase